jgi:NAD(P)H-dependent FMN reductase
MVAILGAGAGHPPRVIRYRRPTMATTSDPLRIVVILGSTRDNRFGETVAHWFMSRATERGDLTFQLVDLRDWEFPYYDHSLPPSRIEYGEMAQRWADIIGPADGFVVITPEYNHGYPAVLKSALDAVYREWVRKPIAFVSYGGWAAGTRSVEQLRTVAIELQMAPIRPSVALQLAPRLFDAEGNLKDPELINTTTTMMLDDLAWWAHALRDARAANPA